MIHRNHKDNSLTFFRDKNIPYLIIVSKTESHVGHINIFGSVVKQQGRSSV